MLTRRVADFSSGICIFNSLLSKMTLTSTACVSGLPRINSADPNNLVKYEYRYSVDESKNQGPVMDRWEQRIGEYVRGAYSVLEPDGRVRTVDYEVDGTRGYHAVIRTNPPSPEFLSSQQYFKSREIFADAEITPTRENNTEILVPAATNVRSARLLHNYHANYHKQLDVKDKRVPVSNLKKKSLQPSPEMLPPSPANYNVPLTTKIIYYHMPAGSIYQKISTSPKSKDKNKNHTKNSRRQKKLYQGSIVNGMSQIITRQ